MLPRPVSSSSNRGPWVQYDLHGGRPCIELRRSIGEDDTETIDVFASESNLSDILECNDPSSMRILDLIVDTRVHSLTSLGLHLPNLQHLNLSGSRINGIRDLGSVLRNIRILSLSACGLYDLDGISACYQLNELYLAYNYIRNLAGITFVESTLEVLDLEGNNIDGMNEISTLGSFRHLHYLNLCLNPITYWPTYNPAEIGLHLPPSLEILDDHPITDTLHQHHDLVADPSVVQALDTIVERIRTGSGSYRSMRTVTANDGLQPQPSPMDVAAPASANSDLTRGDIICGSPVLALRTRRDARRRPGGKGWMKATDPDPIST